MFKSLTPTPKQLMGLFLMVVFSIATHSYASILTLEPEQQRYSLGLYLDVLVDPESKLTIDDVRTKQYDSRFVTNKEANPNFGFQKDVYWIRFSVDYSQLTDIDKWYFVNEFTLAGFFTLYYPNGNGGYDQRSSGTSLPFSQRDVNHRNSTLELPTIGENKIQTYYVRIQDQGVLKINYKLISGKGLSEYLYLEQMLLGLFYGAVLVMFLYNFFIFISVKEKAYFYYLIYLATYVFIQLSFNGFAFQYFYPETPELNKAFIYVTLLCFLGMIQFARHFLDVYRWSPLSDRILKLCLYILFMIAVSFCFINARNAYHTLSFLTLVMSVLLWVIGIVCWRKGNRSARFYVVAWSALIGSMILYAFENLGIIPANPLISYGLLVGSGIEIILLSFALADRINHIRRERDKLEYENKQQLILANEQLEGKIQERTKDLASSLRELEQKHQQLQDAQVQLVQAEKMATLGTLVAGVAHEINNPTHFSHLAAENIEIDLAGFSQLLLDLTDDDEEEIRKVFKQRFERLDRFVGTLKEGTKRISAVVKDLRVFSRAEQASSETVDLCESIRTTIHLVHSNYKDQIEFEFDHVEPVWCSCRVSQINQVLMNILVNACQSIEEKQQHLTLNEKGLVKITITNDAKNIEIQIEDNGSGMKDEVREHLFEPFFTTKGVGEGTGLGLWVSYGLIKEHHGDIKVDSVLSEGTRFTLYLPVELEERQEAG